MVGLIYGRSPAAGRVRIAAALAVACGLSNADAAAGPRVQVRGSARIEMQAFGPASRVTLTGTLRDEVGAAVPRAKIVLGASVDDHVPVAWTSMSPCGQARATEYMERTELGVETDDSGSWCVVAGLGREHASIGAGFAGDALHEGTRSEIVWDAAQRAMTVAFSPRPDRIDLDVARHRVAARVAVPADVGASGLELQLRDEHDKLVASSRTDEQGLAWFEVASAGLGGPGIGELRAVYSGSAVLAATSTSTSITRVAHVRLEPATNSLQGDPTSGLQVRVVASTIRGAVAEGSIEALLGRDVVGTALVSAQGADVPLVFAAPRGAGALTVSIRYVADTPYYLPSDPVQLTVRLTRAGIAARLVPALIALAVAAWLLRGWRRPKRLERVDGRASEPKGVASLEIVGVNRDAAHWSGRVVDAHDATAIQGARIRVIAPSFVDLDVVMETQTDSAGQFAFELSTAARELRLRIESQMHAELERPLPPASDLVVALVSRRRMLLQRLVDWARRAGKPWDEAPEPTPGHVARVAERQGRRDEIASWAQSVEFRAYGAEPVDARAEREVKAMEPGRQAVR